MTGQCPERQTSSLLTATVLLLHRPAGQCIICVAVNHCATDLLFKRWRCISCLSNVANAQSVPQVATLFGDISCRQTQHFALELIKLKLEVNGKPVDEFPAQSTCMIHACTHGQPENIVFCPSYRMVGGTKMVTTIKSTDGLTTIKAQQMHVTPQSINQ